MNNSICNNNSKKYYQGTIMFQIQFGPLNPNFPVYTKQPQGFHKVTTVYPKAKLFLLQTIWKNDSGCKI